MIGICSKCGEIYEQPQDVDNPENLCHKHWTEWKDGQIVLQILRNFDDNEDF